MTFALAIALAALAAINRRIGASWLYPPALFSAVWALLALGVAASGSYFYPIHTGTVAIYLLGAVCVSLGGLIPITTQAGSPPCRYPAAHLAFISRALTVGTALLLVCTPFYLYYTKDYLAGASGSWFDPNVWQQIRAINIEREQLSDKSLIDVAAAAVLVLSDFLPLACFMERSNGTWARLRTWLALALSIICNLATASRGGAFLVVMGLLAIALVERIKIKPSAILAGVVSTLAVYCPAAILMNKGGDINLSLADNVTGVFDTVRSYTLSGLVAFDAVVRNPDSVPSVWNIDRFFLLTANRFGAHFDVAPIHAEFTMVGDGHYQNIYTMYFAYYPDFGLAGVIVISCAIGLMVTWLYCKARLQDKLAILMYAVAFGYICLSGFNENFFLQLNMNLKAVAFCLLLYKLPRRFLASASCENCPSPAELAPIEL